MFYLYHHLGLGDHIICNGMVRTFLEKYGQLSIFCKSHYYRNIKYMFRDNENIVILPYSDERDIGIFLSSLSKEKFKIVGFSDLNKYQNSKLTFDEAFYEIAGIEFDNRFSKFYLERDTESEKFALNILNPQNDKYIYVHDDHARGFSIDPSKHRQDLKIIKNDFTFNLFDMLGIIENAEEVHTMQTGMFDLINSFKIEKPKIFVHTYVRKYSPFLLSKGLNNIFIID